MRFVRGRCELAPPRWLNGGAFLSSSQGHEFETLREMYDPLLDDVQKHPVNHHYMYIGFSHHVRYLCCTPICVYLETFGQEVLCRDWSETTAIKHVHTICIDLKSMQPVWFPEFQKTFCWQQRNSPGCQFSRCGQCFVLTSVRMWGSKTQMVFSNPELLTSKTESRLQQETSRCLKLLPAHLRAVRRVHEDRSSSDRHSNPSQESSSKHEQPVSLIVVSRQEPSMLSICTLRRVEQNDRFRTGRIKEHRP